MTSDPTYSIEFLDKEKYLFARTRGSLTGLGDILDYVRFLLVRTLERNHTRLLVCEREFDIQQDTFDMVRIGDQLVLNLPRMKSLRVACVIAPEKSPQYELIETVFINRSFNFRSFTSDKEAQSWLLA